MAASRVSAPFGAGCFHSRLDQGKGPPACRASLSLLVYVPLGEGTRLHKKRELLLPTERLLRPSAALAPCVGLIQMIFLLT
jgi:hypothetical protein